MLLALAPAEVASGPAVPPGSHPEQLQGPFTHMPLSSQAFEGVQVGRGAGASSELQ